MNIFTRETQNTAGQPARNTPTGPHRGGPPAQAAASLPGRLASVTPPWTKPLTKAIAFAEAQPASIIGLCAVNPRADTSQIAQAFAKLYSGFGKRILFIAANGMTSGGDPGAAEQTAAGLSGAITPYSPGLAALHLSRDLGVLPRQPDFFRGFLETTLSDFDAVVINLPDALTQSGEPVPGFLSLAPACGTVFLVCQTGVTTRAEVRQALAACRIAGAAVSGLLLNDERLPASWLLSDG